MFKRVQIDSTNLKTILGMVHELFEAIIPFQWILIQWCGFFFIVFSKFLNITLLFYFSLVQQLKKVFL